MGHAERKDNFCYSPYTLKCYTFIFVFFYAYDDKKVYYALVFTNLVISKHH